MEKFSYQIVDEQTLFFDLPDGKQMKSKLRGDLKGLLAVIIHGRPGSGDAEPYRTISRFLHERDISSLRLFMYSYDPTTRDMKDCTLDTHVADTEAVLGQLRANDDIGHIAMIGHSYGGAVIAKLKQNEPDSAVWLDPTHGSYWQDRPPEKAETVLGDWAIGENGTPYCFPRAFYEYENQLGDTTEWAVKDYPLKIISAGAGVLGKYNQMYFEAANEPKELVTIADADHSFNNSDRVTLETCQEIYEWIAK